LYVFQNNQIIHFIKANLLGLVTLFFSVGFIFYAIVQYNKYYQLENRLEIYAEGIGTLNSLEEELINYSQLIENEIKATNKEKKEKENEKTFLDVIKQNKNAIKYLQENILYNSNLRCRLGNHYSFLMFLEKDFKNHETSSLQALQPYKKRFINTLFIVIKSNKQLVKQMRKQMHDISLKLKNTWQTIIVLIFSSCLIAIALSVITFLYTAQIEYIKNAEQKLAEKEHYLEMIFEQIPTILYTCDKNLVFKSAKADELLKNGIDSHRLIDKISIYQLFKGYYNEKEFIEAHHKALKGESIQFEHRFKDRYYDMLVRPFKDNNQIIGVIGLAIDITEYKETKLLLELKNKELDSFVYKASHDMRGSLSNIISAAELIKNDQTNLLSLANVIQNKAYYLASLLNDMLELTKVSKNDLYFVCIDVNEFLEEVIQNIDNVLKKDAQYEIINQLEVPFYSDKKLLKSVFLNLIENAFKYKKPDANNHKVKIMISGNYQNVTFKISDNGIGIPDDEKDKVFNMFYRVNTDAPGTGLGLFIVQSAIKRLNGNIKLESKLNNGTNLIVTIPNMFKVEPNV
jgi:signal transduction histidine kinase